MPQDATRAYRGFQIMENSFSHAAERSLLGCIMFENTAIEEIDLNYDDFYSAQYKVIFKTMKLLYESGENIDTTTLYEKMERLGLSGPDILGSIMDLEKSVPTATNIKNYEKIVKDYSLRRKFSKLLNGFQVEMDNSEDAYDCLESAQKELMNLSDATKTGKLMDCDNSVESYIRAFRERAMTGESGTHTGFRGIDSMTKGGFKDGQLIILAARPAMGKTAFAMNLAENIARDKNVLFVSMEMSNEQLIDRLMKAEAIRQHVTYTGKEEQKLEATQRAMKGLKLFIYDDSNASLNDIRKAARKIKHTRNGLGIVIIDYLQLMRTNRKIDNRVQEVSELTRSLKILARELNVPIVALSQLSRAVEQRQDKHPMLSDLRESGSIEQDADIVLFLYRENYYKQQKEEESNSDDDAELIVAKHRAGATGVLKLKYDKSNTLFKSIET